MRYCGVKHRSTGFVLQKIVSVVVSCGNWCIKFYFPFKSPTTYVPHFWNYAVRDCQPAAWAGGTLWHGRGATGELFQAKQEVPLFAMVETAIGNTTVFEMRDAICDKIIQ